MSLTAVKKAERRLTQKVLIDALEYDPLTGVFKWKISPAVNVSSGSVAGYRSVTGHILIGLHKVVFQAHRLAWMYVYGEWPDHFIDHINGCPDDNRIDNLRQASACINSQNQRKAHRNNASGLLGAHWNKRDGIYQARITLKGKTLNLGSFQTAEEAHHAYLDAKRKLHEGCTI